jgi:uncharacterized protein
LGLLEKFLEFVAKIQYNYKTIIIGLMLIFSVFMFFGLGKVYFEGDINKMMPQQLPIYQLNNKINDEFAGQDTVFILIMIDDTIKEKTSINDIRDKQVFEYVKSLEESLYQVSSVENVISISPVIDMMNMQGIPLTNENIKNVLSNIPDISGLISSDYKKMIVIINTDVGTAEEKVKELTNLVNDKIDTFSLPAGTTVEVTGSPQIVVTLIQLLKSDAIYTLVLASVIIILLLIILQRSISKALLIYLPILLGIIWTLGTMGWMDIPIGIATAGLGAMILELGVEYGVFILTRYHEERDKGNNQLDSLKVSVPGVGASILGSGTTTIIGFLALSLSFMPMMQMLGLSLAIGIFYCIIAAVFIEPVFIIIEENLELYLLKRKKNSIENHKRFKTHLNKNVKGIRK